MAALTPFLMFQNGQARPAIASAVAAFTAAGLPAQIESEKLSGPEGPGPEGTVMAGFVVLAGQRLRYFDSPAPHAFDFTPSLSLFVDADSEEQVRTLAAALGEGGQVMMPVGEYPFSPCFGWVNDSFGVSWQLNLAPQV